MSAKQQPAPSVLAKQGELENLYREWRELVEETSVKIAGFRARELQLIEEIRQLGGEEITSMASQTQTQAPKRKKRAKAQAVPAKRPMGRPPAFEHPLAPFIPDGNLAAFAAEEGLEWSRVYGWGRADDLGRRIPEYWAKKWQKAFGIPLDAWPKGVRAAK